MTNRTTVTGSYSADGQVWTRLDAAEWASPDPIMAGVLFSSGSLATYTTAQLSGLSITQSVAPPPASSSTATSSDAGAPR